MRKYHVQVIADNYAKNLIAEPEVFSLLPEHLYGTDQEDFLSGYKALLSLVRRLYEDIADDPAAFGMALKENTVFNAKTADYTQSAISFRRVPNLLYAFGAEGELTPDGALVVNGADILSAAKQLKVTKAMQLFDHLNGYGLLITGAGKQIRDGDVLHMEFSDNRHLLTALKSLALAMRTANKGKLNSYNEFFYSMDIKLLSVPLGKTPKLTIDDFCHVLSAEDAAIARRFDAAIRPYAKATVTQSGTMRNDWGCVYKLNSTKKIALTLNCEQDELSVKMNLSSIGEYADTLEECPEPVRENVLSAWECGHCNPGCAGGFTFDYQGKSYNKCRGGAFLFPNVAKEQVDSCLSLLRKEIAATA